MLVGHQDKLPWVVPSPSTTDVNKHPVPLLQSVLPLNDFSGNKQLIGSQCLSQRFINAQYFLDSWICGGFFKCKYNLTEDPATYQRLIWSRWKTRKCPPYLSCVRLSKSLPNVMPLTQLKDHRVPNYYPQPVIRRLFIEPTTK